MLILGSQTIAVSILAMAESASAPAARAAAAHADTMARALPAAFSIIVQGLTIGWLVRGAKEPAPAPEES